MSEIRVRYAPSPTGHLHIGNARTALFNYLFAKHHNGKFIVRIEDTDVQRNIEGGVKSQLDNLKWLGINWDESIDIGGEYGPYSQLERCELGIYQKYVDKLIDSNNAYRCFCTSEELEADAELQKSQNKIPKYSGKCRGLSDAEIQEKIDNNIPFSVRIKSLENHEITFEDMVKGKITFNTNDVGGDFNILKRDGIPTYNFAVVIDDYEMKISHVLRGEDHISNTPKQIMIYEMLNLEIPKFGHMTLICNEEGKKLSKRDTSIIQFIEEYRNLGYLREAMFNFISLLGFSPVGEEEIFSKETLCEIFDENRLSKSPAKFDHNKLTWINNRYMKSMENEQYMQFIKNYIDEDKISGKDEKWISELAMLYKEEISFGKEINEVTKLFFKDEVEINDEDAEFLKEVEAKKTMEIFLEKIKDIEWNAENIKESIKNAGNEADVKGKNLFMPIRIVVTGQSHGPDLINSIFLVGRENSISRVNKYLKG